MDLAKLISKPKFVVSDVRTVSGDDGFKVGWQINPHMKIGATSLDLAEGEHRRFVKSLEIAGADVLHVPYIANAYDSVFMKDNAMIIDREDGQAALLAKLSTQQRRTEPAIRANYLRSLGIHVESQCPEFLEGGDVVYCPSKPIAFMGYGFRSSKKALGTLEQFLGLPVTALELKDPYFYHLDTAMNVICNDQKCTIFAYAGAFTKASWRLLWNHPQVSEVVRVTRAEALKFALNWVQVNDTIILGGDVPKTRTALERLGKKVVMRPLSQFQLAGGSAACLVAPVHAIQMPRSSF